jgi:drug/metabolite transporter (DMT)-like permease
MVGIHRRQCVACPSRVHPLVCPVACLVRLDGRLRCVGSIPVLGFMAVVVNGRNSLCSLQPRQDLPVFVVLGLSGIVGTQFLTNLGTQLASASDAGMVAPSVVVFTTAIAVCLGLETTSWVKVGGIAIAIAGSAILLAAGSLVTGDARHIEEVRVHAVC